MFSHVIFVLYDVGEAVDNTDEIKKSIEGKGDNITMLVLKYGFPEA
jgi:hypothetical protein